MEVNAFNGLGALQNAADGSSGALTGGQPAMGKEDFLKLLVAQLSHQDPMQPMENTEFVAQLSQFTNVEQLMNVNENLSMLQLMQSSISNTQVAGLLGKEIEARGDMLRHQQQGPAAINFELGAAAKEVTVTIKDAQGRTVRTLAADTRAAGVNTIAWDGKDQAGNIKPAGNYRVEVSAKDAKGGAVTADLRVKGTVSGVSFKDGVPVLEVGGVTLHVGDVVAVRQPGASAATSQ